jgi:hypothetical protein
MAKPGAARAAPMPDGPLHSSDNVNGEWPIRSPLAIRPIHRRPPSTFLTMALPSLVATERINDLVKASP